MQQLQEQVAAALDAVQAALEDARQALAAAHAMATRNPCDGCHPAKAAAIAAAEGRIRICETALDLLDPLAGRLQRALDFLQQVPQDLGEVYELIRIHPGRREAARDGPLDRRRGSRSVTGNTAAWVIPLAVACAVVITVLAGLWASWRHELRRPYSPAQQIGGAVAVQRPGPPGAGPGLRTARDGLWKCQDLRP
jgi:hypothetical protein